MFVQDGFRTRTSHRITLQTTLIQNVNFSGHRFKKKNQQQLKDLRCATDNSCEKLPCIILFGSERKLSIKYGNICSTLHE